MPNTFTTNFNLTKPEIGGANDTWGTLVNTNLDDVDTQLYRKADKNDQKGVTHTLSFDVNTKLVTTNVTRGFASFAVGDKINISNSSSNAANKGEFKIEAITNDITIDLELLDDTEPTFATESISSTVSIISEHTKILTDDLDVTGGTLTTTTAQKDAIVDGSTAITRSGNNLTFAGDVAVAGDVTVTGAATLTSGSITSGVTQNGVVRLVKCVVITGAEYQVANTSGLYIPHDSITVPVTAGKTYIVETEFNIMMEDESDPQDDGNMTSYLRLHNHSAAVEQGDNSSSNTAYGSTLWAQQGQFYSPSSVMDPPAAKGWIHKWNFNAKGAFTAGSTENRYIFITHQAAHGDDDMWALYSVGPAQHYFIYEVTGVTVESLVNTYPY